MTHWLTDQNKSHKKRHAKKGVMSKAQLKEFFGHGFERPSYPKRVDTELSIDGIDYKVTLIPDKNGNICDIIGLPKNDAELTVSENVPSTYAYAMNILRGQAI